MRLHSIQRFLQLESAGGIVLFAAALVALILCNSPWYSVYQSFFELPIEIRWGTFVWHKPLLFWINEGLMTLFFLLVGLELKREILEGERKGLSRMILPGITALGGMLIPAIIYISVNYPHLEALRGWAIPVATDIAFSLGLLSLFGKRVPIDLKMFLMALAIFDDVGAIIIIAVFYLQSLTFIFLLLAAILFINMLLLNYLGVRQLWPYVLLGAILWLCIMLSGIHATLTGVLLAFVIPLDAKEQKKQSTLRRLEKALHPWVVYLVVPLFALANAGMNFSGLSSSIIFEGVTLGIILALVLGKPLGILAFCWMVIKLGWARKPTNSTWLQLFGVSVICGIGFTMSLFLGTLAFDAVQLDYMDQVRVGVFLGSAISGILGVSILQVAFKSKS